MTSDGHSQCVLFTWICRRIFNNSQLKIRIFFSRLWARCYLKLYNCWPTTQNLSFFCPNFCQTLIGIVKGKVFKVSFTWNKLNSIVTSRISFQILITIKIKTLNQLEVWASSICFKLSKANDSFLLKKTMTWIEQNVCLNNQLWSAICLKEWSPLLGLRAKLSKIQNSVSFLKFLKSFNPWHYMLIMGISLGVTSIFLPKSFQLCACYCSI